MAEVTSDGDVIIGKHRPKNNPMIHRSEVGKPSFHNDLPPLPNKYTFGAPNKRDAEGAGEVMLTWKQHIVSQEKLSYDFGRDFVALNKKCVKAKCARPAEVSEFRATNDVRIKPKVSAERPKPVPDKVYNDKTFSYGARTALCDSVADLIQNRWELEWVSEQLKQADKVGIIRTKEKLRKASPTRVVMHVRPTMTPPPHPRDYYSMKKFRDVPSRFSANTPQPTVNNSVHDTSA